MWILFLILAIILLFIIYKVRKVPRLGALTLVNGGVKTGKTALAVHLSIRYYKRALFVWRIKNFIIKVLKKCRIKKFVNMPYAEKPLLYSNIPIGKIDYVPLTNNLLQRKTRFAYKSVIFIDEMSLVADSMMYKDMDLNERLMFFHKLIGHSTRGGKLIVDTQSINDLHMSTERTLSSYIYIHHMIKLPFFCIMKIREERFSDIKGSCVNVYNEDVEDSMKTYLMPKSVFKRYDQYAFSYLTDDLPVETKTVRVKKLKANKILSFKKWRTIQNEEVNK